MNEELRNHFTTADAIAKLLEPYVEVVIHDIESETVAHIANNYSQREIGEPSCFDEIGFSKQENLQIIGPYEKINWNGQQLKSISCVLRSALGETIGLMCINVDVSEFHRIQKALDFLISPIKLLEQPEVLFKEDWHEKINRFIHNWTLERGRNIEILNRNEKRELIEALSSNGAFSGKNAANYIARILKVSRATVYNHLKKQREENS